MPRQRQQWGLPQAFDCACACVGPQRRPPAHLLACALACALAEYAYAAGFDGAWGWAMQGGNGTADLAPAMAAIRDRPRVPLRVGGAAPADSCAPAPPARPWPPQPTPKCTDTPPLGNSHSPEPERYAPNSVHGYK